MDLRQYFKPASSASLPCSKGPLSKVLKEGAIAAANKAVSEVLDTPESKPRGSYSKFTPEQQAEIGRYAVLNGNKAAVRHFSKSLGKEVKESSASTWKKKYLLETKRVQGKCGKDAPNIKALPVKKRGRPLLLGTSLDDEVKSYIRAVREAGGVITSAITIAAATAIVRQTDRNLLVENGGPIALTTNWAKSLLYRMKFVKRKGSTSHKVSVTNFEELKKLDIKAVRDMEDVPPELIFNWDHTGISIVPGSSWTMELKGSKRVEIIGIDDKRQITAVFCGTLAGEFLPLQLIYQGKTKASLPSHKFPDDWHVTFTPNHWSNEDTTKEYIKNIILPYVQSKRKELHLPDNFPALAIYDVFKGQMTQKVFDFLEKNHIYTVRVPANLTDRLQPMDLSVNKPAKGFMRNKFQEWYATEVQKQFDQGACSVSPVDLRLSIMKPLGAKWLVSLYDYFKLNRVIVVNGFKAAGIII
ncbi:hypothetical protein SPONN_625 [uncultured Candidatus Thioglobus sp.]|nr:hypothetical protein SPONN_625 [uncultured Candidatus Thioglobus sp.]